MKDKSKVDDLYMLYGFKKESNKGNVAVYTYNNGYFSNAEAVVFTKDDTEEVDEKLSEFKALGYSTRMVTFSSLENMHDHLFQGFFSVELVNNKLCNDYMQFCELQTKKIHNSKIDKSIQYEYVKPKYLWNNEAFDENMGEKVKCQIFRDAPQLIIIEAAAGFGKTCASYELMNLIAHGDERVASIFIELSKNRRAALFRYVLLDEIDKKFTRLSSDLVLAEIKNGNVPLIIDGFDELISRSNNVVNEGSLYKNEESQTMLDTIAALFQGETKSKVILTSRKSSIFTGEVFKNWKDEKLKNCEVTRVSIEEPTVEEWIGVERARKLKDSAIPLTSIMNPILLVFLKNMSEDEFDLKCNNVESMIEYYFESMLEREKERQALLLDVLEQKTIMRKLAKYMLEFDISSEELSFIIQLFLDINRENYKDYRTRYILSEDRPTEEEFARKLAGHALLNRVSATKNQIGFVSDFVFGILISENILQGKIEVNNISNKHIDIAVTASLIRAENIRLQLYELLKNDLDRFNYEERLSIDLKLMKNIQIDYTGHYFTNLIFNEEIAFDSTNVFKGCIFKGCVFKNCTIVTGSFIECSFFDCHFYNVIVISKSQNDLNLIFESCYGYEKFSELSSISVEKIGIIDYEKILLQYFGNETTRYFRGRQHPNNILKHYSKDEQKLIKEAFECLKKQSILKMDGQLWVINKDKIREIREKLSR